jgi:ABC-2 type transport system permease protein
MSAAVAVAAQGAGPQLLAGTLPLTRQALRRDRVRLSVWVLALGGLTVYSAIGLDAVYPTAADRQGRAAVVSSPAGVLLSGPGLGIDDYTLGAMLANELALTVMVAAAIMSVQLVVRHTRAEEEEGRAELVRATAVGRRAPLTAALLVAALADALLVAVVTAGLAASGLQALDSLALAAGIGLTGLLFGAVGAVTAQLTAHARTATGTALGLLAVAVVVRGVGDLLRPGGSALSWLSPIAWAQQTRAFVDLRWWPMLLSVVLLAVLVLVAYRLVAIRDVGAGLVAPRPGPPDAAPWLSGVAGLAARLQRAGVVGWSVALLLTGAVFGSLADDVAEMVSGNKRLASIVGATGGASAVDGFLAAAALYLGVAAGAFAVGSVLRVRGEERSGRAEQVLAAGVGRVRYLGALLAVTTLSAVLLLVAAGLGTGLAGAAVSGDAGLVAGQLGAQLVHFPAVLVVGGVAAALVGSAPRWSALAWVLVAWAVLAGMFGALLGLPGWALDLSPFGWVPAVPVDAPAFGPLAGLTGVAVVLGAGALAGFRRRDVPA